MEWMSGGATRQCDRALSVLHLPAVAVRQQLLLVVEQLLVRLRRVPGSATFSTTIQPPYSLY
jgi:hypothetical protein